MPAGARRVVLDRDQRPVVGPGQFATHRVANREQCVEPPHTAEVEAGVAGPELDRQLRRERVDQAITVGGAARSALLLDDFSPDVPVSLDHRGHRPRGHFQHF